jgi:hypothetical protein
MPKNKLHYLYAALWLAFFTGIGIYTVAGGLDDYDARKGSGMAALLTGIRDAIGSFGVIAVCFAIGLAFAAWVLFSKEDDD